MNCQNSKMEEELELKDEIEFEYGCFEGCKEVFLTEIDLRKHLKLKHENSLPSANEDPEVQSNGLANNNHPDMESREEFVASGQVEESKSQIPIQTKESAAGEDSETETFHCRQCRNFYTDEENFWKRQDALRISFSNITEVQDQIAMTTNLKEEARDVATQTSEDNLLDDFPETEEPEPQTENPHVDRGGNSRNLQNSHQFVIEEEIQLEMGNSEEFEIDDEIQFVFSCLTCRVIVTTQEDLWKHLKFHKKTSSKSKKLTQNQKDDEELELLKKTLDERNSKSSKKDQYGRTLKRKIQKSNDEVLSSNEWNVESNTKTSLKYKKPKSQKKTIQSHETHQNTEVDLNYSMKLRNSSDTKRVSSDQLKKKTYKKNIQSQEALKKKNVPNTQIPEIPIDKASESNGKDQTADAENLTASIDLNTQHSNNDQNFQKTFEDTQINIPSHVSTDALEDEIEENEDQAVAQSQREVSMFNCQVRVKFTIVFNCDICSEFFLTKQEIAQHMVESHAKRIDRRSTEGNESNETHKKSSRGKLFKCGKCNRQYKRKSALKRHLIVHSGKRPHRCTKCDQAFHRKDCLKVHQVTHSNKRPYKCQKCNKSFQSKYYLKSHQATHSSIKPYKCQKCNQAFHRKDCLKVHQVTHSNKRPYKCQKCKKSFKSKDHLTKHQVTHSSTKPYKCQKCNQAFHRKDCLKVHQVTHSNRRPYKCQKCKKSFKSKHILTKHQVAHSNHHPFICKNCSKAYKRKSDFNRHLKTCK